MRKSRPGFYVLAMLALHTATVTSTFSQPYDRSPATSRTVPVSGDALESRADEQRIVLANGVTIELRIEAGRFLGFGSIVIDGVQVRGGADPLSIALVDYGSADVPSKTHTEFWLKDVSLDRDGLGARIVTRTSASESAADRLTWLVRAHDETWRGGRANGFSYAFRFEGASRKVHQLREHGTWTIGETVQGALWIDQNESYGRQSWATVIAEDTAVPGWQYPAQRGTPEGRLSVGDMIDFVSVGNAALVRFLHRPALTFKELSLEARDTGIMAREWYPTPATAQFETTPMHVRLYRAGGVNAWIDARDHVRERYVAQTGIAPAPCLPGVINTRATMSTAAFGEEYEAIEEPAAYVDWLKNLGIQRTWTWCRWTTAWTQWETLTPAQKDEVQTGLSHAVMELAWDESLVDLERLQELVEQQRDAGIDAMLWIPGGHLSAVSPLRREHPDWVVRQRNGQPFKYVYPDIGGNFYAAGYGAYLLQRLQSARKRIPFTGVWLDSFQVFGLDVIDYGRDGWPNQFDAAADFVRQARATGLNVATETNFPLALRSSTGIYKAGEIDGQEFLAYRTAQHFGGKSEEITAERYFRLVAWMGPPLLRDAHWDEAPGFSEAGARVNRGYNALHDHMHYPRQLPDGMGVLWYDETDQPAALFAFRGGDVDAATTGETVIDVASGNTIPIENGRVPVREEHMYRLK